MLPRPTFLQEPNNPTSLSHNREFNNRSNRFQSASNVKSSVHYSPRHGHMKKAKSTQNANSFTLDSDKSIQCNFHGCRFKGAQDVVELHKKIQHFELRNKYNVDFALDSPEEIAKWKEERKSRYPTLENDKKRSSQQQNDKNIPGLKKHLNRDNQTNNRNFRNKHVNNGYKKKFQNYNHNNRNNHHFKRNRFEQDVLSTNCVELKKENRLFTEVEQRKSDENKSVTTAGSLKLLSCYDSDDESIEEPLEDKKDTFQLKENQEKEIAIVTDVLNELLQKVIINVDQQENVTTVNNCVNNKLTQTKPKRRRRPFNPNLHLSYSKLTLMQKLMLNDVRKVKSELIQSLKFIVESNFLEKNI